MGDVKQRVTDFVRHLPVAHRVVIVAAIVALAMFAVLFVRWVTTPSYTLLYSGLDDKTLATTIEGLETAGVPYKLEGGGSRVLVPREQLYETRAALAAEGVVGEAAPPGYELLDEQGLSVSDFRQRVDYQRALEGELAKTLMAMDGVQSATVRLVLPEEELFTERQEPVTASVLLDTTRELDQTEVEAVQFLVSSSVEGLDVDQITIADADGTVLAAPGDGAGGSAGGVGNRTMRQTREFEQTLAADVKELLERTGGGPASVVVRAQLNFDQTQTETETYGPDAGVPLKEQTSAEDYQGNGTPPGGAVGVDGGPVDGTQAQESQYTREEVLREYGVDKVKATTVNAPGEIERLSVAIVMDDGSLTGADVPSNAQITELVSAALGLDPERGDTVAVQAVPYPAEEEAEEPTGGGPMDVLPQIVAALVLLLVAVALFLMTRRRNTQREPEPLELDPVDEYDYEDDELEPQPELPEREPLPEIGPDPLQADVTELVERQPEEIATLLRSWLADRRA